MLAEELLAARGAHEKAFARYQQLLLPYAREGQKGAKNVGSFFAPRTRWGLWLRNQFYRAFTSKLLIGQFEKLVKSTASAFQLPQYGLTSTMPPALASGMTAPRYGDSR